MKTERNHPVAGPALNLSGAARADIEALRSSDRLQQIFGSGIRPEAGPRPLGDIRAEWIEAPAPRRRGLLSLRRLLVIVGVVPVCLGIAVLADRLMFPDGATLVRAVAGGSGAPENVGPASGGEPAPPAATLEGAAAAPAAAPAADGRTKASGEQIKAKDLAAVIARAVRARAFGPRPAESAETDPAVPKTVGPGTVGQATGAPTTSPPPPIMPEAPASAAEPMRVVIHYRGRDGEAMARRLAGVLEAQGLASTELRQVDVDVSQANVRFYHAETQSTAALVNELIRALGHGSEMRDFTHFSPLPSAGTIEVWLPG